jgi:hypothetical protein
VGFVYYLSYTFYSSSGVYPQAYTLDLRLLTLLPTILGLLKKTQDQGDQRLALADATVHVGSRQGVNNCI